MNAPLPSHLRPSWTEIKKCRETAAELGGFGLCGRPLCCSTWLENAHNLRVSAKMVKEQKLSFAKNVAYGYCCQLKCCLAFECEKEHKK